ncbi:hypothetical protein [Halococcus sp. IIIV-5B]|uniref:hypothetical protein n=1 Tax=Halococcus sp. IIIV-5B TaxID=2321230 RepID=UPI000E72860C|nr:hypothetical protein [Halococcus sp. IIIV-5B]RJT07043.1 hypothetical protein D3261_03200 [Halococcus sp. IIIV-5B]
MESDRDERDIIYEATYDAVWDVAKRLGYILALVVIALIALQGVVFAVAVADGIAIIIGILALAVMLTSLHRLGKVLNLY